MAPGPFALPLQTGQSRKHRVETDVHMHAAARVQVVKSAAEYASAPHRKRRHVDDAPNNAAFTTAHLKAQQRGKTQLREVEIGATNSAMATAHAVDSAVEHASDPPRKRQHAQPRPP